MGGALHLRQFKVLPRTQLKSKRCQPAPPVDNVPFKKERLERQVFQALFIQPTSRTKRQAKRTWASCLRDRQLQMKPAPNGKSRVTSHSATHGSHAKWNTTGDPLQFTYCNLLDWFGTPCPNNASTKQSNTCTEPKAVCRESFTRQRPSFSTKLGTPWRPPRAVAQRPVPAISLAMMVLPLLSKNWSTAQHHNFKAEIAHTSLQLGSKSNATSGPRGLLVTTTTLQW